LPPRILRLRSECTDCIKDFRAPRLASDSSEDDDDYLTRLEFFRLSKISNILFLEDEDPIDKNNMAEVVDAISRLQFLQIANTNLSKFTGESGKTVYKFFDEFESLALAGGLSDDAKLCALPYCLDSYPRSVFSTCIFFNEHFQPQAVAEKAIID